MHVPVAQGYVTFSGEKIVAFIRYSKEEVVMTSNGEGNTEGSWDLTRSPSALQLGLGLG